MFRHFFIIIAFIAAFMTTGCIDYTEELWVNADGTGKVQIKVGLPAQLMAMGGGGSKKPFQNEDENIKIKKDHPKITAIRSFEKSEGDVRNFIREIEVSDFKSLGPILKDAMKGSEGSMEDMPDPKMSTLTFQKLANGNTIMTRHLELENKPKKGEEKNPTANAMAAQMTEGHYLTFIVHAPNIVKSSGEISKDAKMATWKFPMSEIIGSKKFSKEMTAEISMPSGGSGSMLPIIIGLILLGGIIFVVMKNKGTA